MPKRKISEDFACPGCQEQFDTVTHIPFVGSCGHSLCGVCFNGKTSETCPVCSKEGSFASKGRNELAIKLLTALAENEAKDSKKLRLFNEDGASDAPIPAIVDPKNQPFLAQIVNQLDPASFLKLARSCKYLHNYCFNSNDVKIIYKIRPMYLYSVHGLGDGQPYGFFGSSLNRKKLKNYPFHFHLKYLRVWNYLEEDFITSLRSFFSEFPIEAIEEFYSPSVFDWHGFLQLLKDFHVKDVNVGDLWNRRDPIPEDVLAYILQNTVCFNGYGKVPDHLVLNASVRRLQLLDTVISQATFVDLIKRFANSTEKITWQFDKPSFKFGHYELFKVLPYDYNGPLPEERPLIFVKNGNNDRFYILRKYGNVLRCEISDRFLTFSTNDSNGHPIVFPDLDFGLRF